MARKIQFRRGPKDNLPTLSAGEPALTLDTNELYLGTGEGNMKVGTDGKRTCRFVVGTSAAGWTAADVDYLCDGTDDQVEINAAINALPAEGGEIVILDGTYNITDSIKINKANVAIVGNNKKTILKRMWDSVASNNGIIIITSDGCSVKEFHFEGNATEYSAVYNNALNIQNSEHSVISQNSFSDIAAIGIRGFITKELYICDNQIDGCKGNAIELNSSEYGSINNNLIKNCESNGIYIIQNSYHNVILNNQCFDNASTGISLINDGIIIGNYCKSNNNGISIGNSSEVTVVGNVSNNNTMRGIYAGSATDSTISGNICIDNEIEGIYIGGDRNNISNNIVMRGNGTPDDYTDSQKTIFVHGGSMNLISSNLILGKNYTYSNPEDTSNTFINNKWSEEGGSDTPTKPTLTALTADGVVVGQSDWTGTGKMILSSKTAPDYGNGLTNHIRFCLKLQNEEEWQDWTPYYDYNGTAYEFFYSQTRKVYDGLIPNESLSNQQILDKIRWVYKRKPDIIIYGSLAAGFRIVLDGSNVESVIPFQDEGVLRKIGGEAVRSTSDQQVMNGYVMGVADFTDMPELFKIKTLLAFDVSGDFQLTQTDYIQLYSTVMGGSLLPIDTIDNWEG